MWCYLNFKVHLAAHARSLEVNRAKVEKILHLATHFGGMSYLIGDKCECIHQHTTQSTAQ
jgi:hypothetical protein